MNEERLCSLIAAFEKYVEMLVKINDSLPPPHDTEARAKAYDQIYVLSVSKSMSRGQVKGSEVKGSGLEL